MCISEVPFSTSTVKVRTLFHFAYIYLVAHLFTGFFFLHFRCLQQIDFLSIGSNLWGLLLSIPRGWIAFALQVSIVFKQHKFSTPSQYLIRDFPRSIGSDVNYLVSRCLTSRKEYPIMRTPQRERGGIDSICIFGESHRIPFLRQEKKTSMLRIVFIPNSPSQEAQCKLF